MRGRVVAILGGCLLAGTAAAQDGAPLTADEFVTRWDAAQAQADKPSQTAEFTRLSAALDASAHRYKALLLADKQAGRAPRACPARGTDDTFEVQELVDALDALPEIKRKASFDDAFFEFLDRRHPCGSTTA